MHVLSVIHGSEARAELFAPVVEERGHRLDEWSFAWHTPPPRPLDCVRRGDGLRRRDARRPGRVAPVAARRDGLAPGAGRAARAGARHLSRRAAARAGDRLVGRPAGGAGDRLVRRRADGRGRRGSGRSARCRATSRRSSGTTTRTGCRRARSSSRAATTCTQAFRLGDACWGVQFHPEVTHGAAERLARRHRRPAPDPERAARGDSVEDRPLERARPRALRRLPRSPPSACSPAPRSATCRSTRSASHSRRRCSTPGWNVLLHGSDDVERADRSGHGVRRAALRAGRGG